MNDLDGVGMLENDEGINNYMSPFSPRVYRPAGS